MSVQSVTGRIDQILQMQQQLFDPQAAGGVAPAAAPTAASTTAPAYGSQSFSDVLASAQAASPAPAVAAAADIPGGGAASKVQAMVSMADSLIGKPYVFGGGHASFAPSAGYDCSGFVSAVLHAAGYLSAPADTTSLPSQSGIEPGPGQYVTIYDRARPGENGHVIIEVAGQFYESGGQSGAWGGGGAVEKIGRPSDAYLATFPNVLHPAGL
jgi:cell wall-associated NlpC family hydrolase